MSYRDDIAALAARKAALDAEVSLRTRERDEAATMLEEATARLHLPVLANIRIATPCTADWAKMAGDDQVRHCDHCNKDVFNLSAMTREQAESLVLEKNGELCARYYQRKDGTILLADCEVGRRQQRKLKLVAAGMLVTITSGAAIGIEVSQRPPEPPKMLQGDVSFGIDIGRAPPSTGIEACDRYRDSIHVLARCEQMPMDSREALLQAWEQASATLANVPAEARQALADACATAKLSIDQAISVTCVPVQLGAKP